MGNPINFLAVQLWSLSINSASTVPSELFMDGCPTIHSLSKQHISNELLTKEFRHERRVTLFPDGHFAA